jgi:hypothetical protein
MSSQRGTVDVARATGIAVRRDSMESQCMIGRGHEVPQGETEKTKRADYGRRKEIRESRKPGI